MIHHRPQGFDDPRFGRRCLICSDAVGGSLVFSLSLPSGESNTGVFAQNALLRIDGDGKVFLTIPDLGAGQGPETSIPTLIAEELEVPLNRVHLEHAPPKEKFAVNEMLGAPAFDDPRALRSALRLFGEAGATARLMLIAAGARRWGTDARSFHAHEGEVIHTLTWRKLRYGELAIDAAYLPIPNEVKLKAPLAESRLD